jgi:phosphopantothenoylcysteine decarboxylase/phosphopantothenate--cysteine ligase
MGFALAEAARRRGAEVVAVAGVTSVSPPTGVTVIRVSSAEEMAQAVAHEIENASVFIGAAAVADYRPTSRSAQKIKKQADSLTLDLERTPDILAQVASNRRDGLLVIGFAAETENLVANAEAKLRSKLLDAVVANDITLPNAGFETDTNAITILARGDNPIELPLMPKIDAADRILDVIVRLRSERATAKTSSN